MTSAEGKELLPPFLDFAKRLKGGEKSEHILTHACADIPEIKNTPHTHGPRAALMAALDHRPARRAIG